MKIAFFAALALGLMSIIPATADPYSPLCIWLGASADVNTLDGEARDNVQTLIQNERNVVIQNMSRAGATLAMPGGFNGPEFMAALAFADTQRVRCIIITVGGNDFKQATWAAYAESLTAILDFAEAHGDRVLLADLPWRSDNEGATSPTMGIDYYQFRTRRAFACRNRPEVCTYTTRPPALNVADASLYGSSEVARGVMIHFNPAGQRVRATWIERAAANAGLF